MDVRVCTRMRVIDPAVAQAIRMASSCVFFVDRRGSGSPRLSLTSLARYRYVILLQLRPTSGRFARVSAECVFPEPRG